MEETDIVVEYPYRKMEETGIVVEYRYGTAGRSIPIEVTRK